MLEKAILHIGLHKTGSSSIQASLQGYNDGGCFYAELGWANHSIPLYTAFSQNANPYHIWAKQGVNTEQIHQIKEDIQRQLEQQLSSPNHHTIIVSGEHLSQFSQGETDAFVAFLRERCQRIIAVAYVRDPLDYAASAFQQLVKGGSKQIPSSIGQQIQAKIGIWQKALGAENVQIRPFDRDTMRNGCVVQDFCQLAGLDAAKIAVKRRNESLSGAAIKILFHLNHTSPLQYGDAMLARTRQRLIKLLADSFADLPGIDKHLLTSRIDQQDMDYIKANQLIGSSSSSPIDPSPSGLTLEQWLSQLDAEIHARLSDWLIAQGQISSWQGTTSQLIHRTFYAVLHTDQLHTSAKLLMKSALGLRNHPAGNLSDAMELLELARLGRPSNNKINLALQQLKQQADPPNPTGPGSRRARD